MTALAPPLVGTHSRQLFNLDQTRLEIPVDISVVIPMYNEEESILHAVRSTRNVLTSMAATWEIVLVDDGSSDSTLELARSEAALDERISVVSYLPNRGVGRAMRVGFAHVCGNVVVVIDADSSYTPDQIPTLVHKLQEEGYDIVVGSPYMPGGRTTGVPSMRLLMSKVANRLLAFSMNGQIHTVTGLFRAYRREVVTTVQPNSDGADFVLEMLSKALSMGYQVAEVPAVLRGRLLGRSKAKIGRQILRYLFFSFFERPIILFGVLGLILMFLGLLDAIYLLALWQRGMHDFSTPWAVLLILLLLGGLQFLSFGFVGSQIVAMKRDVLGIQRELFRFSETSERP